MSAASVRVWTWTPVLAVVVALVFLGVLGRPRGTGAPLDPNDTGARGAKALVLLLREYGADVELVDGVPGPDVDTALLLSDQMDRARRQGVASWVAAGHRLVVADPFSDLQPGEPRSSRLPDLDITVNGPCPLPGLTALRQLDVGPSLMLLPRSGAVSCFRHDAGAFVVAAVAGRGSVVGLGGAGVWINSRLDHKDNAALAIDVVTGRRVAFLTPAPVGDGRRSLFSLIGPKPKLAVAQLLVAFVLLAWWRGRRFGRPVTEPQPVQIAGSEIVVAVGDLLHRSGDRDAAADQLRDGTRAWLAARAGLTSTASVEQVAAALPALDRGAVTDLLTPAPLASDDDLVRLARSLSTLRTEVSHAAR